MAQAKDGHDELDIVTIAKAKQHYDSRDPTRPLFMLVWLYDTHHPYKADGDLQKLLEQLQFQTLFEHSKGFKRLST